MIVADLATDKFLEIPEVKRAVQALNSAKGLVNGSGRAIVPPRPSDRPSPHFLTWHRGNVFKV